MDRVCEQFVAAAKMAERAGFDMLEIHLARTATCSLRSLRR